MSRVGGEALLHLRRHGIGRGDFQVDDSRAHNQHAGAAGGDHLVACLGQHFGENLVELLGQVIADLFHILVGDHILQLDGFLVVVALPVLVEGDVAGQQSDLAVFIQVGTGRHPHGPHLGVLYQVQPVMGDLRQGTVGGGPARQAQCQYGDK